MEVLGWIVGGAVGGVVGAAIWALIAYSSGHEVGWIAWGVGVLTGLGVKVAAKDGEGAAQGIVAAILAILALAGGKYAAVHFLVEHEVAKMAPALGQITDDQMKSNLADEIATEKTEKGEALNWPAGKSLDTAEAPADYPPGIWDEATKRYDAIPSADREKAKSEMASQRDIVIAALKGNVKTHTVPRKSLPDG